MTTVAQGSRLRLAISALAAASVICFAGGIQAQEQRSAQPCFDVVASPGETGPAGAFLLNRCSGQTWLLVKIYQPAGKGMPAKFIYRWTSLAIDAADQRQPSAPPAAVLGEKCFSFQGRQFCE